eukprot:CAMPEP_0204911340 /NCGR_PEP_ID=MMETSP1397-20131031/9712_1 /ASSEMBLY_ACC=CAM_ASM_000891 /TAXON_ID=49980 /ORGANISM="Climacostomum Climacostomum virens, Strain Stock W-24" /LENGTH=338 /DNA_ID=CAMNT_0052081865 /DNA_START=73 /DNA_END=1085 /DNA_ORIENTATION=+
MTLINASIELLLPMFSLFIIGQTVARMESLAELWELQMATALTILLGLGFGLWFISYIKPPASIKYTVAMLITFSNLGNMPILIVEGSCSYFGPLSGYSGCSQMPGYAIACTIAFNILVWGISYTLISKDAQAKTKERVENFFSAASDDKTSLMSATFEEPAAHTKLGLKQILKNSFCTSVPIGSIGGIVLGCIPGIKEALFDDDAPYRFITNSALTTGFLAIIFTQQILGYNIREQFSQLQDSDSKIIIGVAASKLVIIPLIAQFFIHFAYQTGMISFEVAFVSIIGAATPPGVATMAINQFLDVGIEISSVVFLFLYPMSLLTIPLNCYLFLAMNP